MSSTESTIGGTGDSSAEVGEARALEPGSLAGRYVVGERLGSGAMGTVYLAHDPELDRSVAIKLLRRSADANAELRLTREAQALARLAHPNVVAVHDVGRVAGLVFVAMAFVEGQTLREWQAGDRTWRVVVDAYLQAGRGLAAAHAAGLVHRDFKPDNAMISPISPNSGTRGDARGWEVRVMDFGLARADGESAAHVGGTAPNPTLEPAAESVSSSRRVESSRHPSLARSTRPTSFTGELTQCGAILGTPAYMSPEQHLGLDADARSDQFSFCVALWEALYRERPFRGSTLATLAVAVLEGRPADPKRRRGVLGSAPGSVRRVLLRGLAREPGDRFVDMPTLLSALHRAARVRVRWTTRITTALVVIAGVALGFGISGVDDHEPPACQNSELALGQTWTPARASELDARLRGLGRDGQRVADAVAREVPGWVDEWLAGHRDACEAGAIRRDQSLDLVDRRMTCLDERRRSLDATLRALESSNADALERAEDLLADLPEVSRCADLTYVAAQELAPDDPAIAERVATVKQGLEHARALTDLARYPEAHAALDQLEPELDALARPRLSAWHMYRAAELAEDEGDYERAAELVSDAYLRAHEHEDRELARESSRSAIGILGDRQNQFELAQIWIGLGQVEQRRGGSSAEQAELARQIALVHMRAGKFDEAKRWAVEAVAADELSAASNAETLLAADLMLIGNLCWESGGTDECVEPFERSLEIFERHYGSDHPHTGAALLNLGNARSSVGRLDDALALHRRAYDIFIATHGPDHPDVATTCDALGSDAADLDDWPQALRWHREALAIRERTLAADHPDLAIARHNLGNALHALGELDDAYTMHARALEGFEKGLGPEHPYVALSLDATASVLIDLGRQEEAVPLAERLVELAALDPNDVEGHASAAELLARARG